MPWLKLNRGRMLILGHKTEMHWFFFLLETRLTELSFDIKNVIFVPLSRCSLIF